VAHALPKQFGSPIAIPRGFAARIIMERLQAESVSARTVDALDGMIRPGERTSAEAFVGAATRPKQSDWDLVGFQDSLSRNKKSPNLHEWEVQASVPGISYMKVLKANGRHAFSLK
jgi:hypothetical protein